jgi:hypothetical protein
MKLKRLSGLMHDVGYVPARYYIYADDDEEKEKLFHLPL